MCKIYYISYLLIFLLLCPIVTRCSKPRWNLIIEEFAQCNLPRITGKHHYQKLHHSFQQTNVFDTLKPESQIKQFNLNLYSVARYIGYSLKYESIIMNLETWNKVCSQDLTKLQLRIGFSLGSAKERVTEMLVWCWQPFVLLDWGATFLAVTRTEDYLNPYHIVFANMFACFIISVMPSLQNGIIISHNHIMWTYVCI
jgi:hypothetical protein